MTNRAVFAASALIITLFVVAGSAFTQSTSTLLTAVQDGIVRHLGWFYMLSVGAFLLFVLWLPFSRYGKVRLGGEVPAYSNISWFAMLFSAGLGAGLVFYSVAEPILHFSSPPGGVDGHSAAAARQAMQITFYHWGLHGWAIYILVGLSLAVAYHCHGLPLTIRSALAPLFGKRAFGRLGETLEITAICGTMFGVAAVLGFGSMQINSGLNQLGVLDVSLQSRLLITAVITVVATISVLSGVDRGIRRLSELNLSLGTLLMCFVLFAGPTSEILVSFARGCADYVLQLPSLTFRATSIGDHNWQKNWTLFYWPWWIACAPYVGIFLARISKGRTIREMVVGAFVAPTLGTFFWLTVFGQAALSNELSSSGGGGISAAVGQDAATGLYVLLQQLPWSTVTAVLATIVIVTYFVTSSDSGSLVIDMLTSDGHPDPPWGKRLFWALSEGAVTAVLLATGGIPSIQSVAMSSALPLCFVLLLMTRSLVKALQAHQAGEGYKALLPPPLLATAPKGPTSSSDVVLGAQRDPTAS